MKRISTLAFMAFFFCLGVMAQIELGDIKFSLGEGKKINPATGKIIVTFPNVSGVEDPTATSFVLAGSFGLEGTEWDGVEGTFATGVTFDLAEYDLQPSTDYVLTITSVKVNGEEKAAEGGYKLSFKTRGAERKMAWIFDIDDESVAKIKADDGNDPEFEGANYWLCIKADQRHYVHKKMENSEIMLDETTVLPMTEDLTFSANADKIYVGDVVDTKYKNNVVFNANDLYMTIPDVQEGDVITFNANRATKASSSKRTFIQAMNGAAIAPDGFVSSTGLQDSLQLGSSFANFKFEATASGDITFKISQCILKSVEIKEGQPKVPCKYNVVAAYTADEQTTVLKELVGETDGITGSNVKVSYPYWLTDAEGNAYTHGSKGNEFKETFELNGDTTFVINYAKTDFTGVVYLSEGEDIQGAVLCTSSNADIRSSMCKAGYVSEDTKLVTLQPGTYKIRAILFDAQKTPSYICTLTKGEGEENEIYLSATATNWTEAESDLLTITEATDITLKAGGSDTTGLDVIMIYASEDAPDDPDAIVDLTAAAKQTGARKLMKNGQILVVTEAGTFNAAGVLVK